MMPELTSDKVVLMRNMALEYASTLRPGHLRGCAAIKFAQHADALAQHLSIEESKEGKDDTA